MLQRTARPKFSEKGLLTRDNCIVAMIDLQPQMLFGVTNFDRQLVINNNLVLAKATRVFRVPVLLSTVESKAFSGNLWPQIQAVFPKHVPPRSLRSTIAVLRPDCASRTANDGPACPAPITRESKFHGTSGLTRCADSAPSRNTGPRCKRRMRRAGLTT